jgi:hypothetical protein
MADGNCAILLVDESAAMSAVMRDRLADGSVSSKTNAERVATAVNGLLRKLADGPACDVALIGYKSDSGGNANVGCRWPESLAGREFVSSSDLSAAATIEKRTRRVPRPDGSISEEVVDFSVWYKPALGDKAPQIAAFKHVQSLLERRKSAGQTGQPIIINVFSGASADGSPQIVVDELLRLDPLGIKPLVVQCHLAAAAGVVTSAFPSKQAYLTAGLARDLFSRTSVLSDALQQALKANKIVVLPSTRALVHNAKITDLVRCLDLARHHVLGVTTVAAPPVTPPPVIDGLPPSGPPPAPPTPDDAAAGPQDAPVTNPIESPSPAQGDRHSGEPVGLVVVVLDRSVADPFSGSTINACSRLQEAGNEILRQVSTKQCASLAIDVAIVSYGAAADGQPDIRATFDGPLAGRTCVRNSDLPEGAIRVEEKNVEMSNGAGGILAFTKKTPIYFDLEPTATCPPMLAFAATGVIVAEWCQSHPTGLPPVVLHLTRGVHPPGDTTSAAALLAKVSTSSGPARLLHCVATESAHPPSAYPAAADGLGSDALRALWEASSPLNGWEKLRDAKRPNLVNGARGLVVNGAFDALGEEFINSLAPS